MTTQDEYKNAFEVIERALFRLAQLDDEVYEKTPEHDALETLRALEAIAAQDTAGAGKLSGEAYETLQGMAEYCVENGIRMGMDEGRDESGKLHPWVQELIDFSEGKLQLSAHPHPHAGQAAPQGDLGITPINWSHDMDAIRINLKHLHNGYSLDKEEIEILIQRIDRSQKYLKLKGN